MYLISHTTVIYTYLLTKLSQVVAQVTMATVVHDEAGCGAQGAAGNEADNVFVTTQGLHQTNLFL